MTNTETKTTETTATNPTRSADAVHTFDQRKLSDAQITTIESIKEAAGVLWDRIDTVQKYTHGPNPDAGRMFALAKTKLEETVLWATKGVSRATTTPESTL